MKAYQNLFFLIFTVLVYQACISGSTKGEIDRATTIANTPIKKIWEHPEDFAEDELVTIKGKVIASKKFFGSSCEIKDESGKSIAVKLPDGSKVPSEGAEYVVMGKVKQGTKFAIKTFGFEYNDIFLEAESLKE
jgi:hypothetical protein